jgi:hypothetical protein
LLGSALELGFERLDHLRCSRAASCVAPGGVPPGHRPAVPHGEQWQQEMGARSSLCQGCRQVRGRRRANAIAARRAGLMVGGVDMPLGSRRCGE